MFLSTNLNNKSPVINWKCTNKYVTDSPVFTNGSVCEVLCPCCELLALCPVYHVPIRPAQLGEPKVTVVMS